MSARQRGEWGAALYVNAGGSDPVVDDLGRTWKPDKAYLVSTETNTNTFNGKTVDRTLLEDPTVPNELFLSERWKNGHIYYSIRVPDGSYGLTLYFSENCLPCVSPSLAGDRLVFRVSRTIHAALRLRRSSVARTCALYDRARIAHACSHRSLWRRLRRVKIA